MKEKIVNILVIVGMVVVANYPLYSNLKKTADEVNIMVESVRTEIAFWQKDAETLKNKLESARRDIVGTIDGGISKTDAVLTKIDEIERDINNLGQKIEKIKIETIKEVEDIKDEPVKAIKDLFRG